MKRAPSLEPLLPLDYRQPARGRVSERIYEAVVTLRRGGHTARLEAEVAS